jgi:hypothetical protein
VAAVKDDIGTVLSLLASVAANNDIEKQDFRDWPVFRSLKDNAEFATKFEDVFGEPFFADKEGVEKVERAKGEINETSETNEPLTSDPAKENKLLH